MGMTSEYPMTIEVAGRDTDDISVALGISRASVNSARYRIRRKMNLAKEESLDDLINSL